MHPICCILLFLPSSKAGPRVAACRPIWDRGRKKLGRNRGKGVFWGAAWGRRGGRAGPWVQQSLAVTV